MSGIPDRKATSIAVPGISKNRSGHVRACGLVGAENPVSLASAGRRSGPAGGVDCRTAAAPARPGPPGQPKTASRFCMSAPDTACRRFGHELRLSGVGRGHDLRGSSRSSATASRAQHGPAVQEELALGRIEAELVLVTQQRPGVVKRVSGSMPCTCGPTASAGTMVPEPPVELHAGVRCRPRSG